MQGGLGLLGLEGCFKGSCRQVLGLLRSSAPMLTQIAQALVTDPTVEWTFLKGDNTLRKVRPCRPLPPWLLGAAGRFPCSSAMLWPSALSSCCGTDEVARLSCCLPLHTACVARLRDGYLL